MDAAVEGSGETSDLGRLRGRTAKFEYVRNGLPVTEYVEVKQDPNLVYQPNAEYHPTAILVICSCPGCRTLGQVEFPNGFDFTKGDKLMNGRVTKGFCLNCRTGEPHKIFDGQGCLKEEIPCIGPNVEFIPYSGACDFTKRAQDNVKKAMGIA